MSILGHTPSPWIADDPNGRVFGADGAVVARLPLPESGQDKSSVYSANAKLIEEAPAMAAVILRLSSWPDHHRQDGLRDTFEIIDAVATRLLA